MQIPALIQQEGDRYRAVSGEPFALAAERSTSEEALGKLRQMIANRLADGARLVTLEIPPAEHPLAQFAGMSKDDPFFEGVLNIMAEQRKEDDRDVPDGENPWVAMTGIFRDDPLMDEWKRAMEEYRRQVDEDPDAP